MYNNTYPCVCICDTHVAKGLSHCAKVTLNVMFSCFFLLNGSSATITSLKVKVTSLKKLSNAFQG